MWAGLNNNQTTMPVQVAASLGADGPKAQPRETTGPAPGSARAPGPASANAPKLSRREFVRTAVRYAALAGLAVGSVWATRSKAGGKAPSACPGLQSCSACSRFSWCPLSRHVSETKLYLERVLDRRLGLWAAGEVRL